MGASEQPASDAKSDTENLPKLPDRHRSRFVQIAAPWPELAFLAFLSFYLDRWINTRLIFWNQNDLFLWNRSFAGSFLIAAGQPCQWLGKLLLQACHDEWCGAVAVAAVACLALLAMRAVSRRIAPAIAVRFAWIATALMLVVVHSQYGYDLAGTVSLSLALMATWIYLIVPVRGLWIRWVVFFVESLVLYYLAGGALWTFVSCCLIFEWMTARRRGFALLMLLSAVAVVMGVDSGLAVLNRSVLHLDPHENSYLLLNTLDAWFPLVVFAWCPVCMFTLITCSRRSRILDSRTSEVEHTSGQTLPPAEVDQPRFADETSSWGDAEPPVDRSDSPRWTARLSKIEAAIAKWIVLAIAVVGVLWMAPSRVSRKLLEVDLAGNDHQWQAVLDAARGVPQPLYADYANQDVNQALYHLGRLPEEMFAYPQYRLFCEHGFGARRRIFSRKAFDVLLELGRVNEAEIIAHNDFEMHPSAVFLLRVAETKIIKGQSDAARMYLNVLRDDVCYGAWAMTHLRWLDEDSSPMDREFAQIRKRMITADDSLQTQEKQGDGSWTISTEGSLLSLLNRDPGNRMAFEYLMAHHLLNRDPAAVVNEFTRLKTFAYPRTPLSYEQAALLHAGSQRQKPQMTSSGAIINGCPIRNETVAQFLGLYEIDKECGGFASPSAQFAIQRRFGRSYFAYFFKAEGQENE